MRALVVAVLILAGCGFNGTQRVETSDSEQRIVQDGASYIYVVLRLEFIEQIRELCEDANPKESFTSAAQRRQAVAECTLDNLDIFNISVGQVDDFTGRYCQEDADLSALTPEEIEDVNRACRLLGVRDE